MVSIATSFSANSQILPAAVDPTDPSQKQAIQSEKNREDSLVKIALRDSLHVSQSVISQIFSTRQKFFSDVQEISAGSSLLPSQKNEQLRSLLMQADAAIRNLMGDDAYSRYAQMGLKRLLVIE